METAASFEARSAPLPYPTPVTRTWFNIGGHPSTDALRITERRMVTVWVTLGRRTST